MNCGRYVAQLQLHRPQPLPDTHDCGVATGDVYLKTLMGNILASSLYRHGHTAVVVVWDEDTPVPNIVVSPSVHPGQWSKSAISHYSLLRATEDIFGLPRLLSAADAPDLRAEPDSSPEGEAHTPYSRDAGGGRPPDCGHSHRFLAPSGPTDRCFPCKAEPPLFVQSGYSALHG